VLELYNIKKKAFNIIKIKNMTYKNFRAIRVVIAFFLAMIIAQAVIFSNYILAAFAVAAAVAVIFIARKKVDEVLSDERDLQIAGKAARLSMSIFSVIGAVATFILLAERQASPFYDAVGSTLAYSVCSLLLLYSAIFIYYEKYEKQN
jgi:uncharacterized membrane protein